MMYYNYNPYSLYLQKHNIYYYKSGGLIIKGKDGLKKIKKYIKDTPIGKKFAEILKTDSYYIKLLNNYSKEYKNLSVDDFVNSINGEYNNVNSVKDNLNKLLNHKNSRISNIARNIYNEIHAKELMAKAISLYKRGEIDEGIKILDEISDIRSANPGYLNEFEDKLSEVYTTTPSVNNIIAEENAAKELAADTKKQEAARKRLETRKKNSEKKKYLNDLNSELNSISGDAVDSGNPESIYYFRLNHQYDDHFKGSSADLMSSYIINLLHDDYYEGIIKNSNDIELLWKYLDIYPEGKHIREVSTKLTKLRENENEINKLREDNAKLQELYNDLLAKTKETVNETGELVNKTIDQNARTLANIKKKSFVRRHPWITTGIVAGLTTGGGAIAGALYLTGKGIGKINQAGWELTTGKEADTTTVNQPPVLEQLNNGKTDTIPRKSNISTRIEELYNANQGQ